MIQKSIAEDLPKISHAGEVWSLDKSLDHRNRKGNRRRFRKSVAVQMFSSIEKNNLLTFLWNPPYVHQISRGSMLSGLISKLKPPDSASAVQMAGKKPFAPLNPFFFTSSSSLS